jgi:hypothetical protein
MNIDEVEKAILTRRFAFPRGIGVTEITLCGEDALLTDFRVESISDKYATLDVRHDDEGGDFCSVEDRVWVNYACSIILEKETYDKLKAEHVENGRLCIDLSVDPYPLEYGDEFKINLLHCPFYIDDKK